MKQNLLVMAAIISLSIVSCSSSSSNATPDPDPDPVVTTCERKGDGKQIYNSSEFKGSPTLLSSKYNYARSVESENLILFWDKEFGDDPSKAPDLNGKSMKVDVNDVISQAEGFYKFYRDELQFIKKGSKADQYKMMIFLRYTQEGTVYGGAGDGDPIGALWVEPSRLAPSQPSGVQDAVAHELGHSFQFQLRIDAGGFDKAGLDGLFEFTSQWMLWRVNPLWLVDEYYHRDAYIKQTWMAMFHPANMYHNADPLEIWAQIHGQTVVADMWRAGGQPVAVYKRLFKMDQKSFCDEYYDGVRKMIYYDYDRIREAMKKYSGVYNDAAMTTGSDGWKTISSEEAPQVYGYNTIRMAAPKTGETVTVEFKGNSSAAEAGWHYGFVGKTADGKIVYSDAVSDSEGKVSMKADSDFDSLWLVVMATPTVDNGINVMDTDNLKRYPYSVKID